MAFKMKNTAYYKKRFAESEMASPYNKNSNDDEKNVRYNKVTDQPNSNVEVGQLYKGADKKIYKKEAPSPEPFVDGKVNTAAGFSLDENGRLIYPD